LAASRDNVAHRNADFKNIMKQTLLKIDKSQQGLSGAVDSKKQPSGVVEGGESDCLISDHDVIFWIGDFNYRIDMSLSRENILDMIAANQLSDLRIYDQLNMERSLRKVFENFTEGVLSFPPTYKFQVGTDEYESREGKKKRPPAWCDRILWSEREQCCDDSTNTGPKRSEENKSVRQLSYRSADVHASDHKPVSAEFEVIVRSIDRKREQDVYHILLKELDKLENDDQPKVRPSLEVLLQLYAMFSVLFYSIILFFVVSRSMLALLIFI
jgi:phosphatidylinositol-bisphosphatase